MAIKSKREIERKTEEFVKHRKSELDRILYFVKNNEKGMGYESASFSLKSMAAGISDLADIFKQWANDDRQGKLEESVKPIHKSFRQYLSESWMPDSETIKLKEDTIPMNWLKNLMKDVKQGEGWCTVDYIQLMAQQELDKDLWDQEEEIKDAVNKLGFGSILKKRGFRK